MQRYNIFYRYFGKRFSQGLFHSVCRRRGRLRQTAGKRFCAAPGERRVACQVDFVQRKHYRGHMRDGSGMPSFSSVVKCAILTGMTGLHRCMEDSCLFAVFGTTSSLDGTVVYRTTLSHMEDGLPSERRFSAAYRLEYDSILVKYCADGDRGTFFNLTNHLYLTLDPDGDERNNLLCLDSRRVVVNIFLSESFPSKGRCSISAAQGGSAISI